MNLTTTITLRSVAVTVIAFFLLSGVITRPSLSDGQIVTPGPDVLASNDPDGGALRCEPSVAIHKNVVVVAWNDSYGGRYGTSKSKTGVSVGWAISSDRGKTFKFGGYLPRDGAGNLLGGADSWLAADGGGNFYLQVMSWESPHVIELYYMDHRRLGTWQRRAIAASGDNVDKPAMSVDAEGQIGITYSDTNPTGYSIYFVRSPDGGRSWADPIKLSASENRVKLGAGVAMRGREIIVTWMEGFKSAFDEIWWSSSDNGGRTFSKPTMIYKLKLPPPSPKGYVFGLGYPYHYDSFPWITCSDRSSPRSVCYLACAEGAGSGSRILLFNLPGDGKPWSQPVPVGASSDREIKIMPSVAVAGSKPAVLYYRQDPDAAETDAYISILNHGTTFEDLKLDTVSTDWTKTPGDKQYAPIQRNFGDYITLASDGSFVVAAWTDGRNGAPRVYVRTLEVKGTGE